MEKQCSKCGITKSLDQFYKQKWCELGVRPECKACGYAQHKAKFDPIKHREYCRAYRARNPDADRKYYEKNKPRLIKAMAEYNSRNKEAYLARMRDWRKKNPEKVQVWVRNRRAKLKWSGGEHTIDDIKSLMASQNSKCIYCRHDIRKEYEVDHILPVSKGGSNDRTNLQLLCRACNLDKRDLLPDEYAKKLGLVI